MSGMLKSSFFQSRCVCGGGGGGNLGVILVRVCGSVF